MTYRIELTYRAKKELASLDWKAALLIASRIDEMAASDNPCAMPCAKKLQGVEDGWRWRVGTYRILGTVDDGRITIELFRAGHRRDVYRKL